MDSLTRRSAIGVGAGVALSLAGCSEEAESETSQTTDQPTVTTRTQPTSLGLENIQFCAEQPTGYRQYTNQPSDTYAPSDVVWVYLEPTTVGTEPADEGERRFAFELTWTIHAPDGSAIDTITRTAERSVAESADLSEVYLILNFSPPMEFEPGAYRLDIQVRDTIAGTETTDRVEFTVEQPLTQAQGTFSVPKFIFTDGEADGYNAYTRQPDGEYEPTDRVWYYYEIDGVYYEATDDALVTDLTIIETVTGPNGAVWNEAEIPIGNEFSPDLDISTLFMTDYVAPAETWDPGSYTIALEVTDGYTGETTERTASFTIVE